MSNEPVSLTLSQLVDREWWPWKTSTTRGFIYTGRLKAGKIGGKVAVHEEVARKFVRDAESGELKKMPWIKGAPRKNHQE